MKYCRTVVILLTILLLSGITACSKKSVPSQPGFGSGSSLPGGGMGGPGGGMGGLDDAKWRELGINSEAERQEFLNKAQSFENQDIYFDFNGFVLSEPAKKILEEKANFIRRYPKVKVTIEGHCDERGTTEYNMALGEKRASSALQYLTNSGVGASNMSTISYGKERPIATGHDEAAWAKNRRDHFVLNY